MKLYEYQAKTLFEKFNIPKPDGALAEDLKSIPKAVKKLGKGPWVFKAQVLAGGRGKAGGVKILSTLSEAKKYSKFLFSKKLVTHQTGPAGEKVAAILVEKTQKKIQREMYVSILLDRKLGAPVLLASAQGGMDIETLAKTNPDAILKVPLNTEEALPGYKARSIAKSLGLKGKSILSGAQFLIQLTKLFHSADATLVEVNPLVLTEDGSVIGLDGKITTDDNALFRQPQQLEWKNKFPTPSAEKKAAKAKISYIQLEGDVGCLVNGAGLAMATMDLIKLHGGDPANFLDVGGGANKDQGVHLYQSGVCGMEKFCELNQKLGAAQDRFPL